ncbi:L-lactate dehydrogenase [Orussus abietinus]|uniref:L-lactate dehydrogenase n=1 Tax=Orussus abietinus TaxID=222816 RepID=UPI00062665ED|nr:L-lactate dehydrogenase [Orussus abietinus]
MVLKLTGRSPWRYLVPRRRHRSALPPSALREALRSSAESARPRESSSSASRPGCLRDELFCKVSDPVRDGRGKVTVVGAGQVGAACVSSILLQNIASHVAMVDAFPKKLEGEGMDCSHAAMLLRDPRIEYDTDFCVSSNSRVVIVASGARQKRGQSRMDLVRLNVDIVKNIVPPLVEYSPNAVFVIVSNPVDILSWVTWKVSGLPVNRVIGSGTHLDTARFRFLIAERLCVAPSAVHGYVIGEHGDSQVPVWSGVNVAGIQFRDILPNIGLETDEEKWNEIHKDVIRAGATVRCLKGSSSFAVSVCVADITRAILRDSQAVKTVSTMIQGHHDVCHETFLSLPCVIGENGVTKVIRMRITEHEKKLFQTSADAVFNVQKGVKTKS